MLIYIALLVKCLRWTVGFQNNNNITTTTLTLFLQTEKKAFVARRSVDVNQTSNAHGTSNSSPQPRGGEKNPENLEQINRVSSDFFHESEVLFQPSLKPDAPS